MIEKETWLKLNWVVVEWDPNCANLIVEMALIIKKLKGASYVVLCIWEREAEAQSADWWKSVWSSVFGLWSSGNLHCNCLEKYCKSGQSVWLSQFHPLSLSLSLSLTHTHTLVFRLFRFFLSLFCSYKKKMQPTDNIYYTWQLALFSLIINERKMLI